MSFKKILLDGDTVTPSTHASTHEDGGADEISVTGLSGLLGDPQTPLAHESTHVDGGSDEIDSALDPLAYPMLADVIASIPTAGNTGSFFWATDEGILYRDNGTTWDKVAVSDYPDLDDIPSSFTPSVHDLGGDEHGADTLANLNLKVSDGDLDKTTDPRDPNAHKTSHEDGGSDELSVAALSGELADPQTPKTHKATHEDAGADEISVLGLSGLLGDAQTPLSHATSHKSGQGDEIDLDELGAPTGNVAFNQKQLASAALEVLATAPGTPVEGQIYHSSADGHPYVYVPA